MKATYSGLKVLYSAGGIFINGHDNGIINCYGFVLMVTNKHSVVPKDSFCGT
jgi:hypothetical protein